MKPNANVCNRSVIIENTKLLINKNNLKIQFEAPANIEKKLHEVILAKNAKKTELKIIDETCHFNYTSDKTIGIAM